MPAFLPASTIVRDCDRHRAIVIAREPCCGCGSSPCPPPTHRRKSGPARRKIRMVHRGAPRSIGAHRMSHQIDSRCIDTIGALHPAITSSTSFRRCCDTLAESRPFDTPIPEIRDARPALQEAVGIGVEHRIRPRPCRERHHQRRGLRRVVRLRNEEAVRLQRVIHGERRRARESPCFPANGSLPASRALRIGRSGGKLFAKFTRRIDPHRHRRVRRASAYRRWRGHPFGAFAIRACRLLTCSASVSRCTGRLFTKAVRAAAAGVVAFGGDGLRSCSRWCPRRAT